MSRVINNIVNLLVTIIGRLIKLLNEKYVYITHEDFTTIGGKPSVKVAHITPSTPAKQMFDVGKLAELLPEEYIPAMTPSGKITQQGYYCVSDRVFVSAFGPVKGDGKVAGDYNIDW